MESFLSFSYEGHSELDDLLSHFSNDGISISSLSVHKWWWIWFRMLNTGLQQKQNWGFESCWCYSYYKTSIMFVDTGETFYESRLDECVIHEQY
jgi:hypothetical protein